MQSILFTQPLVQSRTQYIGSNRHLRMAFMTVQDPLPRFLAKAQELGFCLLHEPTELPVPSSEWCSGHDVHTISEPVMGFAMVLHDSENVQS